MAKENLKSMKILCTIFTVLVISVGVQFILPNVSASNAMLPTANSTASGGFLNSQGITFQYTGNYTCNPASNMLLGNAAEVTNSLGMTKCEVGATGNAIGELPLWVSIPAYAGLSIFGVPQLGASSQGFPMYNNQIISTNCGAGGSAAACPDHPTYLYSPVFTAVEQHINITKGVFGLPEGVLPTPAHSHIVASDNNQVSTPWYVVSVLVLDPNIMPDATTGKCTQVVASNLTNPTGNCMTSLAALQKALTTSSSDVAVVNAKNPIWQTLGGPNMQVIVPGATMVTQLIKDNTNLAIPFSVKDYNYYSNSMMHTNTVQSSTVPEFPFAELLLVAGIGSIIVLYKKVK